MKQKIMRIITFLIIFFMVSVFLYRKVEIALLFYLSLPFFVICLYLSYELRERNFWKMFFFNLSILVLLGGMTEAYFTWFKVSTFQKEELEVKEDFLQGGNYYVSDAARGYAAGPNVKKRVKKSLRDQVLYDVVYTTNKSGLRVSPTDLEGSDQNQDENRENYKNIIFFGDSFTYGEGLNDNETLPYIFEELSGGRYRSYNLGFHGYGPQQMLRFIETGLLEKLVSDQRPLIVVYEALVQHIERAAGKLIWDAKIPRYTLSSSGTAEYAGTFENDPQFKEHLEYSKSLANPRSQLLAQTGITRLMERNRTPEDIKLFLQIISQSKNLLEKKYQVKFIVLLWPMGDKDTNLVIAGLKNAGIEILTCEQIFQKYNDPREVYVIAHDNHPSRLANERIARYLLDNLK